jgi:hypothetical protein
VDAEVVPRATERCRPEGVWRLLLEVTGWTISVLRIPTVAFMES